MTPADLYLRFRQEIFDTVEPYLWNPTEVWGYMDDAQTMFCRLTGGLRDASSEAAQVTITTGEVFGDLHESVQLIRHAELDSDKTPVRIYSYDEIYGTNGNPGAAISSSTLNADGPIRGAILGMEDGKLRWTSVPTADDILNMVIERLPLTSPTEDGAFEIRSEHHLHLLMWMKHLAYDKDDTETNNQAKSREFEAKFIAYCHEAKLEKERRNHKPRLIMYGGIPSSGLNWNRTPSW